MIRHVLRHLPFGLASQVLASGTNFLILVALARTQSADDFGWSALSVAAVTALVGVSRSVFGTPIALAAGSDTALRAEGRFGASAAVLASCAAALPVGTWAAWNGRWEVLAICAAAPVLVLHDVLRQICFSSGTPRMAFASDLVRVAAAAGVVAITAVAQVPAWAIVGSWALSAAVAATYLGVALRWSFMHQGIRRYWLLTSRTRRALFGESALVQVAPIVTSTIIGAAIAPVALSGFRGGSTLLGPVSILLTAVPLLVLPRLVREGTQTLADSLARLRPISAALSVFCLAIAAAALVIPDAAGEVVLGRSWAATSDVLPIMAAQFALQPWALAVTTSLRLVGRAGLLLRLRLATTLTVVSVVAIVSTTGSVVWVVVAILAVDVVSTTAYLVVGHRLRHLRAHTQTSAAPVMQRAETTT